jgi:Tfp pilus assembly protein PilF
MKPLAFILASSFAAATLADVVHLKDGTSVEGSIKVTRDGYVVTDSSGKTITVPADSVKSFEIKKTVGSQSSQENLESLRRSVANLDDLKQIVSRYKGFVAQNAGTPAGGEAQKDLAQWQDRLDKGMVKAGRDWVTPDQFATMQAGARDVAGKAVPLVAAGKLKEASALIEPSLAIAPASGELLYVKGVILYRQLQLVPARNAFQSSAAAMPENGAVHNNIAVILWKTRSQMPAMLEFDKAMLAMPSNQTVLDNVAEALHALPKESQKNELTKRVVERFNAQDAALQREMAQHGLYRWGSQWLSQQEYASIQQQQKAVQDKIDSIQKEFDENQQRLIQIAQTIDSDQQLMNQMQAQSVQFDPVSKQLVAFPLPQRFYDLQHDQELLKVELNTRQRQQPELQRLAAEQRSKLPQERYSGSMKIIDVEGLPGGTKVSATDTGGTPAPATQPAATRPANGKGGADY